MLKDIPRVLEKLDWMRGRRIWPNGERYLWTDAFGLVLLVSLYRETGEVRYLDEAEWLVSEVDRVLGCPRGIRIGKVPEEDGQYFHYLAMWMYALGRLGTARPEYRERAIALAREVHPVFLVRDRGVIWKMTVDLSAPFPGYGFGALDHFHGYVVYRLLDPNALASEIEDMRRLVEMTYRNTTITQDLGLGMILWMTHFFPNEPWASLQRERSLAILDQMWIDPPGYFCREPFLPEVKFPFTNYGISVGLQAVNAWHDRVERLNGFFECYRSGAECDANAINTVMACTSYLPGEFLPLQ
ncbi:MAG: hypothetical protein FJZ95_08125 [Chloroflexi bacterium]|nr:hypothetical protein [Chloroflexota bacterium]